MWPLRPVASPLAAPGSVLAVAGDRRIRLKWPLGSQEDLAGYNVYRSSQGQSSTLESGPGPVRTECTPGTPPANVCFTDSGLTNGTSYTYTVKAVDTVFRESSTSSTAGPVRPLDNEPPAPP